MKNSCINHPPKQSLIVIRQWQIDACEGDRCAAALLSFFEYWHNVKEAQKTKATQANDVAERHGDERTQDQSLYQWHNCKELEDGLLGLYASKSISAGIQKLVDLRFVTVHKNPNPRYHFDATRHFLFHPEAINRWIALRYGEKGESIVPKGLTAEPNGATAAHFGQSSICTETSSETTTKTNGEDQDGAMKHLKGELTKLFKRKPSASWSYAEDCQLLEIIRREDWQEELAEIAKLQLKNARFFPQSLDRLLTNWNSVLDRARMNGKATGPDVPLHIQLRVVEERLEKHPARPNSTYSQSRLTPAMIAEYSALKGKKKELQATISGV